MPMEEGVNVKDATHVKVRGQVVKIASTWGLDSSGRPAKPSEGGFGVVTETGEQVSMWSAQQYLRDAGEKPT
jgi:hypothetical protein